VSATTDTEQERNDQAWPPDPEWDAAVGKGEAPDPGGRLSTWLPLDLGAIIAGLQSGEIVGPVPELLARTDGPCLLYPGAVHSISGEPESGKGWIALAAAVAVLASGAAVLYLDFEDSPASIIGRLLALGASAEAIIGHFVYVRPGDPFAAVKFDALVRSRPYALAVVDGVSEAYGLLGLNPSDNEDVVKFLAALPRPLANAGAAVLEIDHVTKSKDSRGRYQIGGQHKLAGIDASYSAEVMNTPSRTSEGLIKLKVQKDRHGNVRPHQDAAHIIALVRITPQDDGERVTVTLEPPDGTGAAGEFRPTHLMERVSRYLEEEREAASSRAVREACKGKRVATVDKAIRALVAEGFVKHPKDAAPGTSKGYSSIRAYREVDDRVPVSDRVPTVSGTRGATVSPCPPPSQGTWDTGTTQRPEQTRTVSRVPDAGTDGEQQPLGEFPSRSDRQIPAPSLGGRSTRNGGEQHELPPLPAGADELVRVGHDPSEAARGDAVSRSERPGVPQVPQTPAEDAQPKTLAELERDPETAARIAKFRARDQADDAQPLGEAS
jgi:hypothetical protein